MSLRDLRFQTLQELREAKFNVPSRVFQPMIFGKGWHGYSRWDKRRIIEQAYERNPAFYAAANIIAQTVADIPIYVESHVDGKKVHADKHPLLSLMDRDSARDEFIKRCALYFIVTGDAFLNIVFSDYPNERPKPLGLINMPAQFTFPIQGDWRKPIIGYKYIENGEQSFTPEEVVHIYNPSLSRYFEGMSAAVPLAETIDLNNAATTWNKNIALGGGMPDLVGLAPGITEEEAQRVQDTWQAQSGANNAHRLKIVGGDMELKSYATSPNDAQWKEAFQTSMRVILMSLGVSSTLMNDGANLTYSNYKEGRKQLYMEGGIPLAKKIYNAITRKLQPYYRDNPTIIVDTDNIEAIQEDKKFAMERLTKAVDGGILTANEARVELGYPLAKGPTADMLQNAKIVNNIPKPDEKIDEELVEDDKLDELDESDEQDENLPDQTEE